VASRSRQDMQKTDRHWELCQEEKCVCAQRVNLNDTYAGLEISYRCNELPARLSVYLSVCPSVCLSVCLYQSAPMSLLHSVLLYSVLINARSYGHLFFNK
jgi:hypothetical protein